MFRNCIWKQRLFSRNCLKRLKVKPQDPLLGKLMIKAKCTFHREWDRQYKNLIGLNFPAIVASISPGDNRIVNNIPWTSKQLRCSQELVVFPFPFQSFHSRCKSLLFWFWFLFSVWKCIFHIYVMYTAQNKYVCRRLFALFDV